MEPGTPLPKINPLTGKPFEIQLDDAKLSMELDPLSFVEATHVKPAYPQQVHDPLGGIVARKGGYLDTPSFLNAVRSRLVS